MSSQMTSHVASKKRSKKSILDVGLNQIIKEFKLATQFAEKIEAEAKRIPSQIPPEEIENREDLRDEVVVTIDGETAKDFDDAISIASRPNGGFCLKVSIADVSHYVRPGSTIDREAFRRATSTYFPDRCLPMLPEKLSNHLCSLVPHEDRLTMTAEMEFDETGRRQASRFYRSLIRSRARLTYTQVRKILLKEDTDLIASLESIVPDLELMGLLADKISVVRKQRGSLDFDLPEPLIEIDLEEGTIDRIVKAERNLAHRLIEEFMIAANEAVAEFVTETCLKTKQGGMIYRVHDEPDPEKVADFSTFLHNLGYAVRLGKQIKPGTLSPVVDAVRGTPHERLVNTLLLRTMKQAVYGTSNKGHFGLASKCYTHFTSPIRRYPDLMVHRILGAILDATSARKLSHAPQPPPQSRENERGVLFHANQAKLEQASIHCSERERNSMKAEWASRDLASALFMKKMIGKRFNGVVASVTRFGLFIEIEAFFVQGLVRLKSLKDDYYIFHEKQHLLVGKRHKKRYQIGTVVTIRVAGVNAEKRWIDFELMES